jgi:hypothetical protein
MIVLGEATDELRELPRLQALDVVAAARPES